VVLAVFLRERGGPARTAGNQPLYETQILFFLDSPSFAHHRLPSLLVKVGGPLPADDCNLACITGVACFFEFTFRMPLSLSSFVAFRSGANMSLVPVSGPALPLNFSGPSTFLSG